MFLLVIEYGAVIQACRKRAGLSQEKLAELMNRSKSCISKYEQNHKVMDMHTLFRFVDITKSQDALMAMASGMDVTAILQQVFQITGLG